VFLWGGCWLLHSRVGVGVRIALSVVSLTLLLALLQMLFLMASPEGGDGDASGCSL